MKTAVILSGEYRTFKLCRKTMTFLDNADVYVSTWPFNIYISKVLNFKKLELVTNEIILNDLGKNAIISLGNLTVYDDNVSKMIDRWITGLRLIKESRKSYERIIICRPDLFFGQDVFNVEDVPSGFNVGWSPEAFNESKLNDQLILGDFDTLSSVINEELLESWEQHCQAKGYKNWHRWWFNYVHSILGDRLKSFDMDERGIICRTQVTDSNSYHEICEISKDFIFLRYLDNEQKFGKEIAMAPNPENFQKAKELWDSGYFKKYMNLDNKNIDI